MCSTQVFFVVEPLQFPFFFPQVFSLLIVAIGVYAKVQKATGTYTTHFLQNFLNFTETVYYHVLQLQTTNIFFIYYVHSAPALRSQ